MEKNKKIDLINMVNSIKLSEKLLEHLGDTNEELIKYLDRIGSYDNDSIVYLWIDSFINEMNYSLLCEGIYSYDPVDTKKLFISNFNLNEKSLDELHKSINKSENCNMRQNEKLLFNNIKCQDLLEAMSQFLRIYKNNYNGLLNNNPFLKASLIQALFIHIQPYEDNNNCTARSISNIKFTELINRIYKTNLTICPLHISKNIYFNQLSYLTKLHNIKFDKNFSESMNDFLDFMLYMYDETLFDLNKKIDKYDELLKTTPVFDDDIIFQNAKKMKLQRIKSH